jgi:hypothetical protein
VAPSALANLKERNHGNHIQQEVREALGFSRHRTRSMLTIALAMCFTLSPV